MKKINYRKLAISLIIPQLAGFLGSIANITSLDTWYKGLIKPVFNPPGWIFGPVWTLLFVLMGVALYLVWDNKGIFNKYKVDFVIKIFSLQIILNIVWSWLFFGAMSPLLALLEIIVLWVAILWNMVVFYRLNKTAGYLLLPYLLWVSFASVLNFSLWWLN
ncbi:MAG TPA: TspO protein [Candidatus Magasanikbacteria bacterium]|nr:TspO protein [Candidatus Magasanikbacteria bacterium]